MESSGSTYRAYTDDQRQKLRLSIRLVFLVFVTATLESLLFYLMVISFDFPHFRTQCTKEPCLCSQTEVTTTTTMKHIQSKYAARAMFEVWLEARGWAFTWIIGNISMLIHNS